MKIHNMIDLQIVSKIYKHTAVSLVGFFYGRVYIN